jgi:hypothetical protein
VDFHIYVRKGVVFVPTTGLVENGLLRDVEPVSVVSLSNTKDVREALRATIARGNPPTPHFSPGKYSAPVVLKYADEAHCLARMRECSALENPISCRNGTWRGTRFRRPTAPRAQDNGRAAYPTHDQMIAMRFRVHCQHRRLAIECTGARQ